MADHGSPAPGALPDRIFALNCYPEHAVRINSYSKPKYLIDITKILHGMPELAKLLASPLGSLFSLHVRQCSLSGQLVHQMLCRQLYTENSDELWFVFGGHPLRFSLQEFEDVTGLQCQTLPPENELVAATTHSEGGSPYWYTLLPGPLGSLSIKEIVTHLKSESNMPTWRKFRLCLIVIVDGILLCRNQPVKPSAQVVEMVKDVDFFLNYPWGRHSFTRLLRMVKVGTYLPTTSALLSKLKQSSMAVHGFPLAIQLFAFKYVPLLLKYLPYRRDLSTFVDTPIVVLPKCKSYHTTNIFDVENDPDLVVLSPKPRQTCFLTSSYSDPKVKHLENLLAPGFPFMSNTWSGGHSALPPFLYAQKRKLLDQCRANARSETKRRMTKKIEKGRTLRHGEGVDSALEDKLMTFKASLMCEVLELFQQRQSTSAVIGLHHSAAIPDPPVPDQNYTPLHSSSKKYSNILIPNTANTTSKPVLHPLSASALKNTSPLTLTSMPKHPSRISLLQEAAMYTLHPSSASLQDEEFGVLVNTVSPPSPSSIHVDPKSPTKLDVNTKGKHLASLAVEREGTKKIISQLTGSYKHKIDPQGYTSRPSLQLPCQNSPTNPFSPPNSSIRAQCQH